MQRSLLLHASLLHVRSLFMLGCRWPHNFSLRNIFLVAFSVNALERSVVERILIVSKKLMVVRITMWGRTFLRLGLARGLVAPGVRDRTLVHVVIMRVVLVRALPENRGLGSGVLHGLILRKRRLLVVLGAAVVRLVEEAGRRLEGL